MLIFRRFISTRRLVCSQFGEPCEVLRLDRFELSAPKASEITVKVLAAPIHPSEINTIQGLYPTKPTFPFTPGKEAIAEVTAVGSSVKQFKLGDRVSPAYKLTDGTWSSGITADEKLFVEVDPNLDIHTAAVAFTNPGSAYKMLHDFTVLKSGDWIIQDGATSAVGIYVMQICRHLGVKTINVIRKRETDAATEETKAALKSYGGDVIFTQEELKSAIDSKSLQKSGIPKLALTCVAGPALLPLFRVLNPGSPIVIYGGMARKPAPVPVAPFIFKDISLRGFWFTRWLQSASHQEIQEMRNLLHKMFLAKQLVASPYQCFSVDHWQEALTKASFSEKTPSGLSKKVLLTFN